MPEASKKSGVAFAYAYNKRNRLNTVTQGGLLKGTYTYFLLARLRQDGLEQVAVRVVANSGSSNGTLHSIYDINGNLIAETFLLRFGCRPASARGRRRDGGHGYT